MPTSSVIFELAVILFTAVISGTIAKRLKQPVILGYLIGGVIVGTLTGIGSSAKSEIAVFAELGIALLMFLLGIEFSFRRFRRVGSLVVWGATIQILLTMLLSTFVFRYLGLDFYSSLFLGTVFSLSSTAVVVKILSEQGLISTLHGQISVGWLLVQDLAVLPIVILLPAIVASNREVTTSGSLLTLAVAIAKGIGYVTIILFAGKYIISYIFNYISKNSRELLLLCAFALCILLSGFTQQAGLSFALGAFLAGILVSNTKFMQAVFSEARPLRDLFSTVFFVSLGFLINPSYILGSWQTVIILVVIILILKFLIVFGLTFTFGYHSKIAFITAVSLVSVGEFAFVLGQLGVSQHLITESVYSLILSVAIITILLTPPLIKNSSKLYNFLYPYARKLYFLRSFFERKKGQFFDYEEKLTNHIILLGYGRVGKYIGRALEMESIPFVVIDYNMFVVDKLLDKGANAIYGDPSNLDLLKMVGGRNARAVIIAIPDLETQEAAITNALTLNKNIKIYARTHYEEDQATLKSLGATYIIQPEFEASLALIHKLFDDLGISEKEEKAKTIRLKIEHSSVV